MSPTTGSKKSKAAATSGYSPGDLYDGPVAFGQDEFHHPVVTSERPDGTEEHTPLDDVRLVTDDGETYTVAQGGEASHNERHGENVVDLGGEA